MKRIALLLGAWCAVPTAWTTGFTMFPMDIFRNDSTTRHKATSEQLRWAVYAAGCSASMLSPKYLLTAHHCDTRAGQTFTSGACLDLGCKGDLKVARIAEAYSVFDGDIVEVSWLRSDTRWHQRYTPKIQTRSDDLPLKSDSADTKVFTVGFPSDKSGATYAEGYAKRKGTTSLYYNIGTIDGNSGGPVWKSKDFSLVSLTNGGPHQLGDRGWRNNDPENSNAWNSGPRMDLLYGKSRVLQDIFPEGANPNVSFEGYLIYDEQLPPLNH